MTGNGKKMDNTPIIWLIVGYVFGSVVTAILMAVM